MSCNEGLRGSGRAHVEVFIVGRFRVTKELITKDEGESDAEPFTCRSEADGRDLSSESSESAAADTPRASREDV
eukprot:CAMPEP_0176027610 /NCGR_PEP_ID=MMETSP0120_2-20121206/13541_1 /TAXON_ID=160619 /ORGANISM="Kryptoperidinium foliaceum, Strain CCMP 1326" /LENGTH=73 /DNA_ID=CAMNT_0017360815 /DNA_START=70 /DNA_END=291 /DNA_ORIENTATION=-